MFSCSEAKSQTRWTLGTHTFAATEASKNTAGVRFCLGMSCGTRCFSRSAQEASTTRMCGTGLPRLPEDDKRALRRILAQVAHVGSMLPNYFRVTSKGQTSSDLIFTTLCNATMLGSNQLRSGRPEGTMQAKCLSQLMQATGHVGTSLSHVVEQSFSWSVGRASGAEAHIWSILCASAENSSRVVVQVPSLHPSPQSSREQHCCRDWCTRSLEARSACTSSSWRAITRWTKGIARKLEWMFRQGKRVQLARSVFLAKLQLMP